MDINNNTQINTFTGGMNTDATDSLMPSDQYRLALNMRLGVKDGEQGGLLYTIEGGKRAVIKDLYNENVVFENIIATSLIRNYGVIIDNAEAGWSVYRVESLGEERLKAIRVFGQCKELIGQHPTVVCRWEDADNVKAYIADGMHPIMLVDILKDNGDLISDISSIVEYTFGGFESIVKSSGNLKPSIIQYAYQLYNKYGTQSQISPLSGYYVVRDDSENKGLPYDLNSHFGFRITVRERATKFERIKLYRITYQQNGQQPTIDLITDGQLPEVNDWFVFNDTGGTEIDRLSVAEFISQDNLTLVPKEIESKGDYLFASNVKYQIEESEQLIQNFYNWDTKSINSLQENNLSFNADYNTSAWGTVNTDYDYWNGKSQDESCKWKFVIETFVEEVSHKSLRRGEIYRYGLVLYDKYGTAWPVKWIADIRTPEVETCPIAEYTHYVSTNTDVLKCKSLGVRFNITIPDTISDYFTKYEIVRCNRTVNDRCTITQGILGRALETYYYGSATDGITSNTADEYDNTNDTTNYLTPSGYMTASNMLVYCKAYQNTSPSNDYSRFAKSSNNILLFSSPEYCYQKDDIQNIIKQYKSSLSIRPVCQYKNRYWEKKDGTLTETGVNYSFDRHNRYECVAPYNGKERGNTNKANALYTSRLRITDSGDLATVACTRIDDIDGLDLKAFCYATWRFRQHFPYYSSDDPNRYLDFRRDLSVKDIGTRWHLFTTIVAEMDTMRTIFNEFTATDTIGGLHGVNPGNFGIREVKYIDVPRFNEFESGLNFTFRNKQVPIQGKNFVPWSVPTIVNLDSIWTGENSIMNMLNDKEYYNKSIDNLLPSYYSGGNKWESIYNYPIGACGEAIIFAINENHSMFTNVLTQDEINNPLCTTVCNVRKTNTIPYGGFTDYARTHSTYYSHGVGDDIPYNNTIQVSVYDGDCFIRNFTYNALKTWYTANCKYAPNMSSVYTFPVETDIDILNDYGDTYTRTQSEFEQDYAAALRGYTQDLPAYMYNTAYSIDPNVKSFTGQDEDEFSKYKFDYRVCYSNPKTNNETTDSWLRFKSANYLDVDTRFGEITNLRLFKDTLMFWQNDAVGVLSANERTVLQDVNDTNIILGNGDILQRFDYITTQYGMKPNQHADALSNTSLYWWDGYRKEILQFKSGQGFTPLKVAKTVASSINGSREINKPSLCYDPKYNEILVNATDASTLVYNEYIEKFTSIYNVDFNSSINLRNNLYLCDDDSGVTNWNNKSGDIILSGVQYVVNKNPQYTKVYDNMIFEGNYSNNLNMDFTTPLNQSGSTNQNAFTKIENDYRLAIPRNGSAEYGDRLRGKTMDVTITSSNDLSILHVLTKYRISWS